MSVDRFEEKLRVIDSMLGEWINIRFKSSHPNDSAQARWIMRRIVPDIKSIYMYEAGYPDRVKGYSVDDVYVFARGLLTEDLPEKKWVRLEDYKKSLIDPEDIQRAEKFMNWCKNTS